MPRYHALVLGASQDEGRHAAELLAKSSLVQSVSIADENLEKARTVANDLRHSSSARLLPVRVDAHNTDEVLYAMQGHDIIAAGTQPMTTLLQTTREQAAQQSRTCSFLPCVDLRTAPLAGVEMLTGSFASFLQWQQQQQQEQGGGGGADEEGSLGEDALYGVKPDALLTDAEIIRLDDQVGVGLEGDIVGGHPQHHRARDDWTVDRGPSVPSWDKDKNASQITTVVVEQPHPSDQAWRRYCADLNVDDGLRQVEQSEYLLQLACMGMPTAWRGLLWCYFGGALHRAAVNPGYYHRLHSDKHKTLLDKTLGEQLIHTIEMECRVKYIPAFCTHERCASNRAQERLCRILKAFCYYTHVNTVDEDMGLVARAMLIHMQEERVFWLLVVLVTEILPPDYYSDSNQGVAVDALAVKDMLASRQPHTASVLKNLGVEVDTIALRWLLSTFLRSMQFETAMRVWDVLFFEGAAGQGKILLECAMAALVEAHNHVLLTTTTSAAVGAVSTNCRAMEGDRLIQVARMQPCVIKAIELETMRLKHRSGLHQGRHFPSIVFPRAHICLSPASGPHVCHTAPSRPPSRFVEKITLQASSKTHDGGGTVVSDVHKIQSRAKTAGVASPVNRTSVGERWLY